ncbi:MAG: OmpA family protein [Candidatus Hydrogenedentes bacterium]|nr:OmpA family protein [Candidatus Hydrogenedentota bacterium]
MVRKIWWFVASAFLLAAGCSRFHEGGSAGVDTNLSAQIQAAREGGDTGSGATESLEDGHREFQPVYFDYDAATLRPDALETLKQNAALLRERADLKVALAGHCDERGTQEYNLALGEKRALAVRDYLVMLGLPRERFVTMSYGEEYPMVEGHDEISWQENRRCDFNKAQ